MSSASSVVRIVTGRVLQTKQVCPPTPTVLPFVPQREASPERVNRSYGSRASRRRRIGQHGLDPHQGAPTPTPPLRTGGGVRHQPVPHGRVRRPALRAQRGPDPQRPRRRRPRRHPPLRPHHGRHRRHGERPPPPRREARLRPQGRRPAPDRRPPGGPRLRRDVQPAHRRALPEGPRPRPVGRTGRDPAGELDHHRLVPHRRLLQQRRVARDLGGRGRRRPPEPVPPQPRPPPMDARPAVEGHRAPRPRAVPRRRGRRIR